MNGKELQALRKKLKLNRAYRQLSRDIAANHEAVRAALTVARDAFATQHYSAGLKALKDARTSSLEALYLADQIQRHTRQFREAAIRILKRA